MANIISEVESAFVLKTPDLKMIAFEIGHYMKQRSQDKLGIAALKLDMFKAYDRDEWNFL